jgi:hypothetical protein
VVEGEGVRQEPDLRTKVGRQAVQVDEDEHYVQFEGHC